MLAKHVTQPDLPGAKFRLHKQQLLQLTPQLLAHKATDGFYYVHLSGLSQAPYNLPAELVYACMVDDAALFYAHQYNEHKEPVIKLHALPCLLLIISNQHKYITIGQIRRLTKLRQALYHIYNTLMYKEAQA